MRFPKMLPMYLFLLGSGPALAEPPEYPPDAILTSDVNFQIDHCNDDSWNHAMAKALKSAESFSWPLQKECGDKVVDVRKPGYDPQCELTIQYKTYVKPPGVKDELPYLSFLIWNTDQKTGKVWRRNACRANGEDRCLIPGFDGAILSTGWKDALWARFFMGAPRRQRRSVERYNIVKRA